MTFPKAPVRSRLRDCRLLAAITLALAIATNLASAGLAVTWSKSFAPLTIGPGSVSTLTFTITNGSPTGVRNVFFTDVLPAGVTLADPANPVIDCDGVLSAPDRGNTITLTDGTVPGNGSCTITVNVTGAEPGIYTNVSGDLTSDAGNSGAVAATLAVDENLPGFSKSFSPEKVGLGGRTTLTFTIDNSFNEGGRDTLTFTDVLPAGLVVADPPNVVNNCGGGTITATPGSGTISLAQSFPTSASVGAFQTCTLSVDVVAQSVGRLLNISGELNSTPPQSFTPVSSGKATAALEVTVSPILFIKSFIDDPVIPGSTVAVEYSIVNRSREFELTDIRFSDDLNAALPGLVATGLPASDWCGPGSRLEGTSRIQLSGGRLGPQGSCTFRVPLRVPGNAPPGIYPSTTSVIRGTVDGRGVSASPATDALGITIAPTLSKEFLGGPGTPGGEVTLRFTITNNSERSTASAINFDDELPPELSTLVSLPDQQFCGPDSTIEFTPSSQFDVARIIVSNAELAPRASCSFDVVLRVDPTASTGTITNTTGPISAMIEASLVTGDPASATLAIVSAPQLSKVFLDNPILPGKVARLQYTLTHNAESPFAATNISFTDNLDAVIPGMRAVNLPLSDVCGPGSLVRGDLVVDFRGGVLAPGRVCSFVVEVLVPQQTPPGTVTNVTSPVTATLGDTTVMSGPASADLLVTGISFTKRFLENPVIPGEVVGLRFTILNSGEDDVTNLTFTDDLDAALPGLTALRLPLSNICGSGSSLQGAGVPADSLLVFTGGSLTAGSTCSFDVLLQVPPSAPVGEYINVTSALTARIRDSEVVLPGAAAVLELSDRFLEISKTFSPNPAQAGRPTTLEFTLTNIHPTEPITNIAFSDVLPAGLSSAAGTLTGICGPLSQLTGTGTLSFSGGLLPAGASCTFSVPLSIPPQTPIGTVTNTTSQLSGRIKGLAVRGDPASAILEIRVPLEIREIWFQSDGTAVLEYSGTPGQRYCIEWTSDLNTWTRILPPVPASAEISQWVDSGPPLTPTLPADAPRRFYRVVEKDPQ